MIYTSKSIVCNAKQYALLHNQLLYVYIPQIIQSMDSRKTDSRHMAADWFPLRPVLVITHDSYLMRHHHYVCSVEQLFMFIVINVRQALIVQCTYWYRYGYFSVYVGIYRYLYWQCYSFTFTFPTILAISPLSIASFTHFVQLY